MAVYKVIGKGENGKYFDDKAWHDVISYALRESKTPNSYVGSRAVNIDNAESEMSTLARLYNKTKGVHLRHSIISFAELKENEHNHTNQAFNRKIRLCAFLADNGLDVESYVKKAVKGRSWRELTDEDVAELTETLCDVGESLGEDLIEWSVATILEAKENPQ